MKKKVFVYFKVLRGTKEDNKECLFLKSEVSVSQETNLIIQRHRRNKLHIKEILFVILFSMGSISYGLS